MTLIYKMKNKKEKKKRMGTNWMDVNTLIFFIIPIVCLFTGYLKEAMIAIVALLSLKALWWFVVNFRKLNDLDKLKKKKLSKS